MVKTARRALAWEWTRETFDNDGWQDLFVANIDQEKFSLYHNLKNQMFADVARVSLSPKPPAF